MTPVYEFLFLLCCHLTLLVVATGDGKGHRGKCPSSFNCGSVGNISFPFTTAEHQDCGLLAIHNCDGPQEVKRIQLQSKGKWFRVVRVQQNSPTSIQIIDDDFYQLLQSRNCGAFRNNYTLPPPAQSVSFSMEHNATLFRCNHTLHVSPPGHTSNYTRCPDYILYYSPLISVIGENSGGYPASLAACTKVQLPIKDVPDGQDPFTFVTASIVIQVHLSAECANCHYKKRGQCQLDSQSKFCWANGKLGQDLETQAHTS